MEEIVIPRKKSVKLILTSLLSLAILAWIIIDDWKDGGITATFWVVVSSVFFLFSFIALIQGLRNFFSRRPAIIISDQGVEDFISSKCGLVKWEEITGCDVSDNRNVKSLLIHVRDAYSIEAGKSRIARAHIVQNTKKYGTPFVIHMTYVDRPVDEVKEMILERIFPE